MIKLYETEYYVDEHNNRWDSSIYTLLEAIQASKRLDNCTNCTNCEMCADCHDCDGCYFCSDLAFCKDCWHCQGIIGASYYMMNEETIHNG